VAPDSGWFMYTPLSSQPVHAGHQRRRLAARRHLRRDLGGLCRVEFTVTVLKVRTGGMSLSACRCSPGTCW
jgi:cytochrome c oxidase subunit I+III